MEKGAKILVAGAEGQLGSDTAAALTADAMTVKGLNSRALDITDKTSVLETVKRERPAFIVNCAAYTKVDDAEREPKRAYAVNRDGARNLAMAARETGAVLIHISTDFVYDGNKSTPYGEEDVTGPIGIYGHSKLAGEEEIQEATGDYIIIRTSWLYGIRGRNFVKTMLGLGRQREVLRVIYDQAGTPTWTADLAGVILRAVKASGEGKMPWGVYHYSNEGVASWYDFALAVMEEAARLGVPLKCKRVEPILTSEYPTPARRPSYSVLKKEKIKDTLGITIPHWKSSLEEMLKRLLTEDNE